MVAAEPADSIVKLGIVGAPADSTRSTCHAVHTRSSITLYAFLGESPFGLTLTATS